VRIEGTVAVVTGAASGIGLATALALARRGADTVVLVDRNEDRLAAAVEAVTAVGAKAHPCAS